MGSIYLKRFALPAMVSVWLCAVPALVNASEWAVQPAASGVQFEYTSDGIPKTGIFARFEGIGSFDPADPAGAELLLKIDTSSIDLYDDLASGFAQSAEWFDSKNHPDVVYTLLSLELIEGTRYRAKGQLVIRGEERPITSEIDLAIEEDAAAAEGELRIVRGDYLLGVGPSAIFVDIGPEVIVSFDLQAARVR